MPAPTPSEAKNANAAVGASARLQVRLPADAKLYVDDYLTQSAGAERNYRSPDLAPGAVYSYELRAEVTRNGRTTTQTKLVRVQTSQTADVSFEFDAPQVAQAKER